MHAKYVQRKNIFKRIKKEKEGGKERPKFFIFFLYVSISILRTYIHIIHFLLNDVFFLFSSSQTHNMDQKDIRKRPEEA